MREQVQHPRRVGFRALVGQGVAARSVALLCAAVVTSCGSPAPSRAVDDGGAEAGTDVAVALAADGDVSADAPALGCAGQLRVTAFEHEPDWGPPLLYAERGAEEHVLFEACVMARYSAASGALLAATRTCTSTHSAAVADADGYWVAFAVKTTVMGKTGAVLRATRVSLDGKRLGTSDLKTSGGFENLGLYAGDRHLAILGIWQFVIASAFVLIVDKDQIGYADPPVAERGNPHYPPDSYYFDKLRWIGDRVEGFAFLGRSEHFWSSGTRVVLSTDAAVVERASAPHYGFPPDSENISEGSVHQYFGRGHDQNTVFEPGGARFVGLAASGAAPRKARVVTRAASDPSHQALFEFDQPDAERATREAPRLCPLSSEALLVRTDGSPERHELRRLPYDRAPREPYRFTTAAGESVRLVCPVQTRDGYLLSFLSHATDDWTVHRLVCH